MKKVLSTLVAALVALSFSAVVFAADAAPAVAPADATHAGMEMKKEATPAKKAKKTKKAKKAKAPKKAVAPAAETTPSKTTVPAPGPVQQ
jgi:type IV secretory pathway VirB6-like protein